MHSCQNISNSLITHVTHQTSHHIIIIIVNWTHCMHYSYVRLDTKSKCDINIHDKFKVHNCFTDFSFAILKLFLQKSMFLVKSASMVIRGSLCDIMYQTVLNLCSVLLQCPRKCRALGLGFSLALTAASFSLAGQPTISVWPIAHLFQSSGLWPRRTLRFKSVSDSTGLDWCFPVQSYSWLNPRDNLSVITEDRPGTPNRPWPSAPC